MALAEYFGRNALAVAQIAAGMDEAVLADRLKDTAIAIGFGEQGARPEGRALLDLLVRLIARFYPAVSFQVDGEVDSEARGLASLARSVNPRITIRKGQTRLGIAVGEGAPPIAARTIFVGSDGWDAIVSSSTPHSVGESNNPFGAGAAACLAYANVFRETILESDGSLDDRDVCFSMLDLQAQSSRLNALLQPIELGESNVLVGLGAIGNAAAWALSRTPCVGRLHLVDHENIELSNLQRYVLARHRDEHRSKVKVARGAFTGDLQAIAHHLRWEEFVNRAGYKWSRVLVAVDSARDRRAVQASLPRWIANAWTQPGDLGLSVHTFEGGGACLNCLYLPERPLRNEDELIADALGVPERLQQIRELLYFEAGTPIDLLLAVADKLGAPLEKLMAFEGRPLRSLYVEGVCGGAILALGKIGTPRQEVHVPLVHQSAMAGLLLSAALVKEVLGIGPALTSVTRMNLLRPLAQHLTQPALKDRRGICICEDSDYISAYRRKFSQGHAAFPEHRA